MSTFFVGQVPAIEIAGGIVYLAYGSYKCAMPVGAFGGLLASGMREIEHFQRSITNPRPLGLKPKKGKKRKH